MATTTKTTSKKAAAKKAPAKAINSPRNKHAPLNQKSKAQAEAERKKAALAEAKKEAARLERQAEKEAKAAQMLADKEEKKAKAEKHLTTVAKEINTRFEKASKLIGQADDHRLAAACRLAEARDECRASGITFKAWVEENVKKSYKECNKLLQIGAAENDEEGAGAKMLEDMRADNAERNRKLREKKKAENTAATSDKAPTKTKPAGERAVEAVAAMKPAERKNFIKSHADDAGLAVVDKEVAREAENSNRMSAYERAQAAFNRLSTADKIKFVEWADEQIEETDDDGGDDGELEIPENLKRNK